MSYFMYIMFISGVATELALRADPVLRANSDCPQATPLHTTIHSANNIVTY